MRIQQPGTARAAYYDRNPTPIRRQFVSIAAPAGVTNQWTYTVPAGRKAILQNAELGLRRVTAAAPVGLYEIGIFDTDATGVRYIGLRSGDNVVDAKQIVVVGQGMMLSAGAVIVCANQDTSAGGTVDYMGFAQLIEYDA